VKASLLAGLDLVANVDPGRGRVSHQHHRQSRPAAGGEAAAQNGGRDGPPDLDELWRDFNRKLSGLFGGKGGPRRGNGADPGGGPNFQPSMRSAGVGAVLIGLVVLFIWLGSGIFIVQEGQQAVVTQFGRYSHTVDAGIQWRFPYPFQANETVGVTQLRSKARKVPKKLAAAWDAAHPDGPG
jgi:membrane protease subunit HflK